MSIVSIVKCDSYDTAKIKRSLDAVFEHLGGLSNYVTAGMQIALKVNLVMGAKPEASVTTHPSLVSSLCDILTAAGASVTIIDSPGNLYKPEILKGIYRASGLLPLGDKPGVSLNYNTDIIEVENPSALFLKKLTVLKPLVDADLVINLPKMKTHCQMIYTGAVKNMFGAVPGLLKMEYHFRTPDYDNFADSIIDIFLSVKPRLSIMDGVVGLDGYGPTTAGRPCPMGVIIASEDAFALDRAASFIMGIDLDKIPLLRRSVARGFLDRDIDAQEYIGETPHACIVKGVKIPKESMSVDWAGGIIGKFLTYIMEPKISFKKNCTACGHCMRVCPAKAITIENRHPSVDRKICIKCFCCHELCPSAAIEIKRSPLIKLFAPRRFH